MDVFLVNVQIVQIIRIILVDCQELCRDIYDLYAEYEEEEVQDRFPVSPHLLLSPAKHLNLNINVGGTVSSRFNSNVTFSVV